MTPSTVPPSSIEPKTLRSGDVRAWVCRLVEERFPLDAQKWLGRLKDECLRDQDDPRITREIWVIVVAIHSQSAESIKALPAHAIWKVKLATEIDLLQRSRGLDDSNALWAVVTWALALGVATAEQLQAWEHEREQETVAKQLADATHAAKEANKKTTEIEARLSEESQRNKEILGERDGAKLTLSNTQLQLSARSRELSRARQDHHSSEERNKILSKKLDAAEERAKRALEQLKDAEVDRKILAADHSQRMRELSDAKAQIDALNNQLRKQREEADDARGVQWWHPVVVFVALVVGAFSGYKFRSTGADCPPGVTPPGSASASHHASAPQQDHDAGPPDAGAQPDQAGELKKAQDGLKAEQELRSRLFEQGSLSVEEVRLSASVRGNDGKAKPASRFLGNRFPAGTTLYVEFTGTIRNNAVSIGAGKGPLCVKYMRLKKPNGEATSIESGSPDFFAPPQPPNSPCSFGLPINVPGTKTTPTLTLGANDGSTNAHGGWGAPDGSLYSFPGAWRIEFWCEGKKVGQREFEIVQPDQASKRPF